MEKLKQIVLKNGLAKTVVLLTLISVIFSVLIAFLVGELFFSVSTKRSLVLSVLTPLIIAPLVSVPFVKLLFQIHALETKMRELATVDALTGLQNRRSFIEQTQFSYSKAVRENQSFCVLLVDLDLFKQINDQYGHVTGDAVLVLFGQIVKKISRESDVSGRIGGEEFCFFLPNASIDQGEIFANRLHAFVREASVDSNHPPVHFSVSIGLVASYGKNGRSIEELMQLADQAMYEAKKLGRNQTVKVIDL